MSQAEKERKSGQNLPTVQKRQLLPVPREHPEERAARLKREDSDARCKRIREMIVFVSVAFISVGSFTVLAVVLLSGSYPSTDKLVLISFITQLLTNLFLYMGGKMPKFNK
jgi:hypothetical protein